MPENTLALFKAAIEIGCDRTKLDIRLTKDSQLVVIHDKEVSRLTDGFGLVSEMNLSELQEIKCEAGEHISTLQEVMDVGKNRIDL